MGPLSSVSTRLPYVTIRRKPSQNRRLRIEPLEDRQTPATLTLTLADDQISEAAGAAATTGTLTRGGTDTSQPLTVALNSSDTTEASVPTQVTFGAGETSIPFNVNAVDDVLADGNQSVTVTGTATVAGALAVDSSFAGGRTLQNSLNEAVAIQPDGKVVVTGPVFLGTGTPNYYDILVTRYNPNGSVDSTFTSSLVDISGERDDPEAIAIAPDGKIVVAGTGWNGPKFDWILARFNSDGTLDNLFGAGGKVLLETGPGSYSEIWDVVVQPDGKILAAGNIDDGAPNYGSFTVARFNTDGTLDNTFGTGGFAKTLFADRAFAIALQSDGKIVLAGEANGGNSNATFALARLTTAGILDSTFGSGGTVTTNITGSFEQATDVVIQPDGKLVVSGYTSPVGIFPPVFNFVVARYNSDGTLDNSFGTNGVTIKDLGGDDQPTGIGLQADGQIILGGTAGANKSSTLARFTSAGVFESSLGVFTNDLGQDIAIAPSGRAYAVGYYTAGFTGYIDAFNTGQVLTASDTVVVTDNEGTRPTANADGYSVDEDHTLTVNAPGLLANDSDPENDPLIAKKLSDPAHGTVTVNSDGSFTYTPNDDFVGTDSFTYAASDGTNDSNPATVTITVYPINDVPTLDQPDPLTIPEDAGQQLVDLTGITAGPGESQTLTIVANSDNPALLPNPTVTYSSPDATGTLQLTPVANTFGTATITVTITDDGGTANGGIDTLVRTFTVNVTPVNDPPTLDLIPDQPPVNDTDPHTVNLAGITAGLNESQGLSVNAVSDNPALVQTLTVNYTSANSTGTLAYSLAPTQSGFATITVTVTDDGGTANGGVNSFSRSFTVGSPNDSPTLDAIPDPAAIPEDAGVQQVSLSGISAGGGETQLLTVTATSSNPALIPDPTVVYTSPNATGVLQYQPLPDQWGTAVITVKVRDDGGTVGGGVEEVTRTFNVTVTPQPDGPILDTSPIRMIAAVPRKPAPTNPPGSPVADLVSDVMDVDGDPHGIAITTITNVKGIWQYSLNGGTTWQDVPTALSPTAAFLLADDPATRLRFLPKKGYNGFSNFRFKAWDQSAGTNGTTADTTLVPTAYSAKTETGWVAVGRTRPVVDSHGATVLAAVKEDRKWSRNFQVKTLLGIAGLEMLPTTNLGIAITGLSSPNGKWQYRQAKMKSFVDIGGVNLSSPLLLKSKDYIRFLPNPNANGSASLTFKTWNQVDTTGAGLGADFGGAVIDIIPINDRPVMDLSVPAVLDPVDPGQTTNARTFASMMSATDVESPSIGVAIFAAKGTGWEYKTAGGSFVPLGKVSSGKALLLDADAEVRYGSPVGELPGTATLSFKAWDKTPGSGVAGTRVAIRGAAFSRQTEVVTTAIGNFTPVLETTPDVTLPLVTTTNPKQIPGTYVKTLVGIGTITDTPSSLQGIALVFADNTNGKWQYSLDGRTYLDVGTVSAGSALLLGIGNKIRFVPNSLTTMVATIQYKAWDRTTGQAGDRIDTGLPLNSFSVAIETAKVGVV